jgi:hypothetical protein
VSAPLDDVTRKRWSAESGIHQKLCEHIWGEWDRGLHFAGEEWEPVYEEDMPDAYKDDTDAVLLRRLSDGQVFEVVIDVTLVPVKAVTS